MKRNFTLIVLLICSIVTVFGQKYTISGYIKDAETGENLIGATVFDNKLLKGTASNDYGYFSLTLPEGAVELDISFVGYQSLRISIDLKEDLLQNFELISDNLIDEVTVTSHAPKDEVQSVQMGSLRINSKQVKSLPVMAGEADLFKSLQLMPGVQSGTEGTSGLYVRGGGPDQNLILLDGVPIYNAGHLAGFLSTFNPDAISNVKLIKGGFPARYGGRLSSVVDIRLKEGNMKDIKFSGSVGMVSSRFLIEGPIVEDQTSFLVSLRRSYIDLLAKPLIVIANRINGDGGSGGAYFYDANLKINHKFSDKDRIFLSSYMGRDKGYIKSKFDYIQDDSTYTSEDDMGIYWGNITTALRWNHMYGRKFFSNISLIYSDYTFDVYENYKTLVNKRLESEYKFDYYSGIEDVGAIIDFDYYPSPSHAIKFGGKYLYHSFKPGVTAYASTDITDTVDQVYGNNIINAHEYYVYVEDKINLGKRVLLNVGLHFSAFHVEDRIYKSLDPRFSTRILLTNNLSFKAAVSKMQQYIHLLTNPTIGLPTDLWLPSTNQIPPEKSWQYSAGLAYNLRDKYSITLEGFYKSMDNAIEYKPGQSYLNVETGWQEKVDKGGIGWSYGGELFVRKDVGNFTGWIGYTLSKTMRQFENQNSGRPFPYTYDRRHDISLVGMYKFNEKTDISAVWVYGTGRAVTLAVARYAEESKDFGQTNEYWYWGSNDLEYYKGKNGFREPAYHRLDLAVNRHKQKEWGKQTWSFGLYNAYNRLNPFLLRFDYDMLGNRKLFKMGIFPVIPSVSYSFSF